MKYITLIALVALTSCGRHTKTKYVQNPFDNSGNDARLGSLENRVGALESAVSANIQQISTNSSSIASLSAEVQAQAAHLTEEIARLDAAIAASNGSASEGLLQLSADMIVERDNLQAQLTVVSGTQASEKARLTSEVTRLEQLISSTDGQIRSDFTAARDSLQGQINAINGAVSQYVQYGTQAYNSITAQIGSLSSANGTLSSSVATLQSQMLGLTSGVRVTDVVDPCPAVASTGFKEYFYKLSDGTYSAYFEQNGNRFLTKLLVNQQYRTTDQRACYFSINSSGQITH